MTIDFGTQVDYLSLLSYMKVLRKVGTLLSIYLSVEKYFIKITELQIMKNCVVI